SAASRWPKNAARWSGGQPSWDHCPPRPGSSRSCRQTSSTSPIAPASKKLARAPRSRRGRTLSGLPVEVAIRSGGVPRSSRAFARSGPAASRSPMVFASPRRMAPSRSAIPLTSVGPARGPWGRRLRLQEGRRGRERLVPRPGETALRAFLRERPLAVPLAPRLLVVDLEAVAVGIGEVDADRNGVVGDTDRDLFVLEPLVHLAEVAEVGHAPGDVVQPDLLLLGARGLFAHLEERDVVRVARVAGEEGAPQSIGSRKRHGVLDVKAEDLRVPLEGALGVPDEDVDVVDGHRLVSHLTLSCGRDLAHRSIPHRRRAPRPPHSVRILSAPSTSATSFGGSENAAFFPARSSARTPRAREQAPQTWIGTRCAITFASASESGAQPTGTTAFATTVRISETASPSKNTWTSWPPSANAFA